MQEQTSEKAQCNGILAHVLRNKFFKRIIGITCALIFVIGAGSMMYMFEGARIGIPIALGICAIVIGATWGLSE